MYTPEEVRQDADIIASGLAFPNAAKKLLDYADLLEAMNEWDAGAVKALGEKSLSLKLVRQCAEEKQKARKG